MPGPDSPMSLTEEELREIRACLDAGAPLPEAYRFRLFAPVRNPVLLWPGKTLDRCRAVHPLLTLEEHRPGGAGFGGRAGPEWMGETAPGAWKNLLIRADNLLLLSSLRYGPLRRAITAAGGIKLIYIDPPFAVGTDFTMPVTPVMQPSASGHGARRKTAGTRLKALAYRDSWEQGIPSFLTMIHERLLLMRELLAEDGSLYLHCDWRLAPHMRLVLDEIFGPERFLGDIVWHYTGGGRSERYFSRKHDRLLHYAASNRWIFNVDAVRVPYKPTSGYARNGITSAAGKHYTPNPLGTPVDDVWDIPMINPLAGERLDYPTQKPETLLERIVKASSRPGDLVADFFCGSGTLPAVAETLGRKWLAVDSSALAVHTARKRLLGRPLPLQTLPPETTPLPFLLAELAPDAPPATAHTFRPAPGPGSKPAPSGGIPEEGAAETSGNAKRLMHFTETFAHEAHFPAHSLLYGITDLRMAVQVTNAGFSLELAGFSVFAREKREEPPLFLSLLRQGWPAWLDYWSIGAPVQEEENPEGMTPAPEHNRVLWHSAGVRKGKGPDLCSPCLWIPGELSLRPPVGGQTEGGTDGQTDEQTDADEQARRGSPPFTLLVTIVDVFANESRVRLTLSPQ